MLGLTQVLYPSIAYGELDDVVAIATDAVDGWDEKEVERGQKIISLTDTLRLTLPLHLKLFAARLLVCNGDNQAMRVRGHLC